MIAEGVEEIPQRRARRLVLGERDRPEFFYKDGYHLRPKGQRIYADLISSHLPEE